MANTGEIPSHPKRFFRVISYAILQSGDLELPEPFVRANGKHLSKHAHLKVPTGDESRVVLKMSQGRAWLRKGWQEFVDKYSIQRGCILEFKYQGSSRFNVAIFGLSCTEIKYHVSQDKDSDVEVVRRKPRRPNAMTRLERKVASFKTENPHFRILMNKSYVRRVSVTIPAKHAKTYLKEHEHGRKVIRLYGSNGRSWDVKYHHCPRCRGSRARKTLLTNGWCRFVWENHLEKGDYIVFEKMSGKAKAYKVTFFRVGV